VGGKWLEVLKEMVPQLTHAAFMFNPPSAPTSSMFVHSAEEAARKFAVQVIAVAVHTPAQIEEAINRLGSEPGSGLMLLPDTFTSRHYKLVIELASRNRVPGVYPFRYMAAAGGLVSYGPDIVDQFRRAVVYVDRILRGEKASDLPVQQPTKFEFVINLKAAKALALDLPPTLLARADEVIE
jgi:putative tryptophan/tyrosine transport system substrate-binding protein